MTLNYKSKKEIRNMLTLFSCVACWGLGVVMGLVRPETLGFARIAASVSAGVVLGFGLMVRDD